MSGRTIGTVAGAVVGAVIGYFAGGQVLTGAYLGASLGATVGGVAGALYDTATAPDAVQEQQSLADLSIQTSTYGNIIVQVWGSFGGIAGNIIDATQKVMHEHREEQSAESGKGGGPSQITITKTYSITMAIGLADTRLTGPIAGISKIYRDLTLIYDRTQDASLPDGWTFYDGAASQVPDPTFEAIHGVGNTPPYRYLAYAVVVDDNLGQSGRTYNYTFDLYQEAAGVFGVTALAVSPADGDVWGIVPRLEQVWHIDATTGARIAVIQLGPSQTVDNVIFHLPLAIDASGLVWVGDRNNHTMYTIDDSNSIIDTIDVTAEPYSNIVFTAGSTWVVVTDFTAMTSNVTRITSGAVAATITIPYTTTSRLAVGLDGHLWVVSNYPSSHEVNRIDPGSNSIVGTVAGLGIPMDLAVGADGDIWVIDQTGNVVHRIDPGTNTVRATVTVGTFPVAVALANDDFLWVANAIDKTVTRINPSTNSTQTFSVDGPNGVSPFEHIFAQAPAGAMWVLNWEGNTVQRVSPSGSVVTVRTGMGPISIANGASDTIWVTGFGTGEVQHVDDNGTLVTALAASNSLAAVVSTLCDAAGLVSPHIDVTDLPSGNVNMALVSMQAVRAPLQQLADAFRFYVIESGLALKFRAIGSGGIVVDIPESDLDAGDDAATMTGLIVERVDDVQLPTEIDITYVDPAQNYQGNTQRAQLGISTDSLAAPRTQNIALALTADQAKALALQNLNALWAQREMLTGTLSRTYAYLEPGDRFTITARGLEYTAVMKQTTYGHPGILEFEAIVDAGFTRSLIGPVPGVALPSTPAVSVAGDTTPLLLNVPALTSSDQAPRYHVAYIGAQEPWPGGALYRSVDGEATYQQIDAGFLEGITGMVSGGLPDVDYHFLDTTTVFTVVLEYGTLTSIADIALYNGHNLCLVGDEVLAFGEANLVGPRTYACSRLLRGRRGTEWAVSTHGPNETFVLLDAAVRSLSMNLADRNVVRPYKAVSLGQSIDDATAHTFTPTAANLNPYTPAQVTAALVVNDWHITWYYRSRFAGDWVDGGGVGWDVDAAGFEVIVYTDNTYATIARAVMTDGGSPLDPEALKAFVYTAAMQTADFGGLQATLYYQVYQITNAGISRAENLVAP